METDTDKIEAQVPLSGRRIICELLIILLPLGIWSFGVAAIRSSNFTGPHLVSSVLRDVTPPYFMLNVLAACARVITAFGVFIVGPLAAILGMYLCYSAVKRARFHWLAVLSRIIPFLFDLSYILICSGLGAKGAFYGLWSLIDEFSCLGDFIRDYLAF